MKINTVKNVTVRRTVWSEKYSMHKQDTIKDKVLRKSLEYQFSFRQHKVIIERLKLCIWLVDHSLIVL